LRLDGQSFPRHLRVLALSSVFDEARRQHSLRRGVARVLV